MPESSVYQSGNTIFIEAEFYDINNNLCDPDIVKINFYDEHLIKTLEAIPTKLTIGKYRYSYKSAECTTNNSIVYEIYGEISGLPTLKRRKLTFNFI